MHLIGNTNWHSKNCHREKFGDCRPMTDHAHLVFSVVVECSDSLMSEAFKEVHSPHYKIMSQLIPEFITCNMYRFFDNWSILEYVCWRLAGITQVMNVSEYECVPTKLGSTGVQLTKLVTCDILLCCVLSCSWTFSRDHNSSQWDSFLASQLYCCYAIYILE